MLPSVFETIAAVVAPKRTAVASLKLEPLMTTVCPPTVLPVVADKDNIAGDATKRYAAGLWAVPATLVAAIATVPATLGGALRTTEVDVLDTIIALSPPTVTDEMPDIAVPVRVIVLPPSAGPATGETAVMVGGAGAVYVKTLDLLVVPSGLVTDSDTDCPTAPL